MIVTAVLAAQIAGTFDVADTTRFSVRASQPPPLADAHVNGKVVPGEVLLAADASTGASARLRLRERRWEYSLGVTGSVSASDLEQQVLPLAYATANASQGWRGRLVSVSFSESGSYGLVSAAVPYQQAAAANPMMTSPGMTGQPMMQGQPGMQGQTAAPGATTLLGQQQATVSLGSFDGAGNLGWRLSHTTAVNVQAGYSVSGGLDTTSRSILPEAFGPRAALTVSTTLSRTESLTMSLRGRDTISVGFCTLFQSNASGGLCREEVPDAEADASLRHKFSHTGTVSVSGGVAATVAATPGLNELVLVPIGSATVTDTFGREGISGYVATVAFTPTVDIRTGLPSNRVTLTGVVSDRFAPRALLSLSAGLTQSLPFPADDPYPLTTCSTTAEVRYLADRKTTVGVGLGAFVQHQSVPGGGPEWAASEIAYISVTANGPTLHF
jgi:hypothetical protein